VKVLVLLLEATVEVAHRLVQTGAVLLHQDSSSLFCMELETSVANPHVFYADLDPAKITDADPFLVPVSFVHLI
jgi:hypothetical protein